MNSHKMHKNHKRMLLEWHPCRDHGREKDFPPTRPQEPKYLRGVHNSRPYGFDVCNRSNRHPPNTIHNHCQLEGKDSQCEICAHVV